MGQDEIKERIGQYACRLVQDGMVIGLGTGTTSSFFIDALASRYEEEHLDIVTVSSSFASERMARERNLPCVTIQAVDRIDITFDGADEIDPQKRLIKGRGGALLREKILAYASNELIILVDESKCVDSLGAAKLPVEVVQFGHRLTATHLLEFATSVELRRRADGRAYISDNQNFIYDIQLKLPLAPPEELNRAIKMVPGVVETGFFIGKTGRVIIGCSDGTIKTI